MMLPDPVDHDASCQWIIRTGDPSREFQPAAVFRDHIRGILVGAGCGRRRNGISNDLSNATWNRRPERKSIPTQMDS